MEEAEHFSAYAAGTNYKVNPDTPFWARVMIDPDLPITDLLKLEVSGQGMIDFALDSVGPHITTLSDLNNQRDYSQVNAPTTLPGVWQALAAVGFYDTSTDGDVRIPYWHRTVLETLIPWHREAFDIIGGPTQPNRQQRLGILEEDDFLTRSLKTIGGQALNAAGIKTTTPADVRQKAYRQSEDTRTDIKEKRIKGELPSS